MPIYEYQCTACEHLLEALQQLGDAPLHNCPACGQDTLRRRISAAAFRFKGSGWYETDFKTGKRKNLADSGSGDKAESHGGEGKEKAESPSNEKKTSDQKGETATGSSTNSGSATANP